MVKIFPSTSVLARIFLSYRVEKVTLCVGIQLFILHLQSKDINFIEGSKQYKHLFRLFTACGETDLHNIIEESRQLSTNICSGCSPHVVPATA